MVFLGGSTLHWKRHIIITGATKHYLKEKSMPELQANARESERRRETRDTAMGIRSKFQGLDPVQGRGLPDPSKASEASEECERIGQSQVSCG